MQYGAYQPEPVGRSRYINSRFRISGPASARRCLLTRAFHSVRHHIGKFTNVLIALMLIADTMSENT